MEEAQEDTAIKTAFVTNYYERLKSDRVSMAAFYRDDSRLTWQGKVYTGAKAITDFLLALTKITHVEYYSADLQKDASINILVTGEYRMEDAENGIAFSHFFRLAPCVVPGTNNTDYYISNEMFR